MIRTHLARPRKPWLLLACLLLAIGMLPSAAQAQLPLTSFDIGASPNPVGDGFSTTLTAFLSGISGVPAGTVDFYISSDVSACSADTDDLGTATINANTGVASLPTGNFYSPGPQPICAIYNPAVGTPYGGATAGVYLLTVNQPATLLVTSPGEVESGTAINFSFAISVPNGQPTPTGTVTLYDENTGAQLGQVTIVSGTVPPINGVTLTTGAYYAYYSGDGNYIAQYNFGTVFQANGLEVVNPAIIDSGSANTTVTLTGLNFNTSSIAYLAPPSPTVGPTPLTTTYISPTQIQAVIPSSSLKVPGILSIYVVTGVPGVPSYTTNSLQIQAVLPFADSVTVSANPTTFPYGTSASSIFGSTVTPTGTTDGGVPAGPITFSLNPTGGGSFTSWNAPLTQNTQTAGTYIPSALSAIDTGSSKMLSADFNNDGYFDIVSMPAPSPASLPNAPYLQVMLSTGADTFASEEQVFTGCVPEDFAVGDLNNDGFPDLVVACQNSGNGGVSPVAEYILGNGDGSFQAPVAFATNAIANLIDAPTEIIVGDFNGDGYLDAALVDGYNGFIQVLFNDEASPFDGGYNASSVNTFDTSQGQVVQAAAADFNQDGYSDAALLAYNYNGGGGAVLILTSNGFGGFNTVSEQTYTATTYVGVSMAVTDVNGDNYPDVAVADPGTLDGNDLGQIIIFENQGNGALNTAFALAEQGAGSVTGAPFPVVGAPASNAAQAPTWNLLFSGFNPSNSGYGLQITPLQRLGFNNWQVGTPIPMNLNESYNPDANSAYPVPLVASDVNGDGYLDATLAGLDANNAPWLQSIEYNNGAVASLNNTIAYPTAGTYNLTANYGGNYLFAGGASSPVAITVTQATPTGSISGPPSVNYGAPATFTATITGVAGAAFPSGTVQFYSDGNLLDAPVNVVSGVATLTTTNLLAGSHTITATYSGDTNYLPLAQPPSSGLGPIGISVVGLQFTLNLTSSTTQTTAGTVVTFTVSASGDSFPTLEQVTLTGLPTAVTPTLLLNAGGVASWSYGAFIPNDYSVTAVYNGDGVFAPTSSNGVNITVNDTPVSVSLQPNVNPDTYPTPVNLTSTVTSNGLGVPVGSVDVQLGPSNNPTDLGSGNLVAVNGASGLYPLNAFASSGLQQISMTSGDFNGDGIADLAWLQGIDGANQLYVALGNGDGTFQTPVVYSTGVTNALALATGIFNQALPKFSGIAIAGSGGVAIFLPAGDAAGDLNPSQTLAVSGAVGVATGDFNKDGNPDLAVITATTISAFYGTASGVFPSTASWSFAGDGSNYVSITAADLNGDGYADFAVSDTGNNQFWVYLWSPTNSTFSSGTVYQAGQSVGPIAAGDINGDGFSDIAVVSPSDSTVEILINNKSGGFPTGSAYGVPGSPDAIAIADFNKDGYADVAVAGTQASELGVGTTVLLGSASGAMTGEAILSGGYGAAMATGDFTGDGNPDLAIANFGITPWIDSSAQFVLPSVALPAGTDALTSTFTASPSTFWASGAQGTLSETVNQGLPPITWSTPAPITYGTALSNTQLDATSPVAGTFSYTPPGGTVLPAGTQTLTANFAPTDSLDYQPNTAQVSIVVNQAGTSVDWSTPGAITYGTALSATQLNATASVPGTFAYTPAAGTVLTAGTHTLSVTFTPTDSTDYTASTASVSIVVNKATSSVTWSNPAAITYGTALGAAQLNATASVPGTFAYSPAAGTVLGAGTHLLSVTFTPTDTTDYQPTTAQVSIVVNQAGTTITWSNPAAITYGTALSATQLNATASVPGTFAYSPGAGTVLTGGTHTLNVTFTPTDTADYSTSTASVSIVVNKATTTVTWTNPAAISYGTALSATQLNATASVPGTFAYAPAAGTVLTAGTHTLNVTFTPTDTTDYQTSTGSVSIVVNQATPTVTWSNPAGITYGTALSATQLDATASVPGTFAYTPAAGTILTAGTHTLSVTFTPTDAVDYSTATTTASIVVSKATPTITWGNPASISYGTALSATQLNATASTPGTFAYTPAAGTVLAAGTHTLSVTFTPTDTTDYQTNTAQVSITVNQAGTTITWANPAAITYGTALSATQLDATASVPGTFSYSPGAGTVLTGGTHTLNVTFTPTDTTDYTSSTASVTIVVNKATTTVTWANPAAISYGTALGAAQLNATASVPGTFAYTPAAGTVLTAGTHTLNVTFTPTDTTDYQTSTASVSIVVNKATATVTWANPAAISYGTALSATQLDATASVPGTFAYNPAAGTILTAGSHTLNVTFTPTDTTDYSTSTASVSIVVNKATPTITWANPAAITYGTALGATQLNATASTPGTFLYSPPAGTVLTAGTHTLSVTFTPTDTTDYTTTTGQATIVVNQSGTTVTWATPAAITYGTALGATQLDATASVPGTFVYTPAAGTVLTAGTHALSVTFTPTDTADYKSSTGSVSILVNKATPTITWANPAGITYGTALSATQLNATASVPGTFAYSPAAGAVLTAGTHTLSVTFTPTDATDYATATGSVSIVVGKATPTVTWRNPAAITYGTALSATQLNATASVPGTFVYSPAAGTVLTAGSHTLSVTFTPTDATDYTTQTGSATIVVNQATPTLTWRNPAAITYGTALSGTQLNATSSVPGNFTYSPAAGTVLTAGTQTLTANFVPTDTADYKPTSIQVTIVVNPAGTTITWANPAAITYGTVLSATQLDATASVPGTFAYTPAAGTVLTAGTHTLSVTFTPTDATDYSTSTKSVSIVVNKAAPTITWANPAAITYGTALGAAQLNATASTPGTFTYTPAAGTVLTAGTQTLSVTFTPTDATDYTTAAASVSIVVSKATPTITWANPTAISFGTPLSATQLNATATPSGGAFVYTPAVGAVLPVGTDTLSVTYTPTDTTDYTTATKSVSIVVNPGLALTSISPSTGVLGSAATTITLTGTGFSTSSTVQVNGTTISSSYFSPTMMTAVLPASFFLKLGTGLVTVTTGSLTTPGLNFTVESSTVQAQLTGPPSADPGQQPTIDFTLTQGYPLDLLGTLTLSVAPITTGGPVDPSVQFSTGGTTFQFTIPANTTTTPKIQLQAGTLPATITVTLTLTADGQDVTPEGLAPVVIDVPVAAPTISSVTLARDGDTLTVTVQGFSSTRQMNHATFTFTAADGSSIENPTVTVPDAGAFADWYNQSDSTQYGSAFTYVQNFTLSNNASTIGGVSVTLTNSSGTSNSVSAH